MSSCAAVPPPPPPVVVLKPPSRPPKPPAVVVPALVDPSPSAVAKLPLCERTAKGMKVHPKSSQRENRTETSLPGMRGGIPFRLAARLLLTLTTQEGLARPPAVD